MLENAKNNADMLHILELRDKMPVNIKDRAKVLIDAYTELKRESPDMTEFADKKMKNLNHLQVLQLILYLNFLAIHKYGKK